MHKGKCGTRHSSYRQKDRARCLPKVNHIYQRYMSLITHTRERLYQPETSPPFRPREPCASSLVRARDGIGCVTDLAEMIRTRQRDSPCIDPRLLPAAVSGSRLSLTAPSTSPPSWPALLRTRSCAPSPPARMHRQLVSPSLRGQTGVLTRARHAHNAAPLTLLAHILRTGSTLPKTPS